MMAFGLRGFARDVRYSIRTLTKHRIFSAVAVLTVALATGGVHGVVSYIVERRTREIGLRLALGASAASVRRLIGGQVLIIALVAFTCGVAVVGVLRRAIASLLFGVDPLDPSVIGSVAALILLVTLAASAIPVSPALRIDPMVALKSD